MPDEACFYSIYGTIGCPDCGLPPPQLERLGSGQYRVCCPNCQRHTQIYRFSGDALKEWKVGAILSQ